MSDDINELEKEKEELKERIKQLKIKEAEDLKRKQLQAEIDKLKKEAAELENNLGE